MKEHIRLGALIILCISTLTCYSCSGLEETVTVSMSNERGQEVTWLPGLKGSIKSKQYTGYITVDEGNHRELFYWLVTSERNPAEDPVVLWLSGGPGCSCLDAFIYEHGPFNFTYIPGAGEREEAILLQENLYSWSKVASIIYVDSPAGTGLSTSRNEKDYNTNDDRTVADLVVFLHHFFLKYPELEKQDFYIAGESYGGVIVPLLAHRLMADQELALQENRELNNVNLKGYMIGNAVTDDAYDRNGQVEFAYSHGLIGKPFMATLSQSCGNNYWNATEDSECARLLAELNDLMGPLNPYDINNDCHLQERSSSAGRNLQAASTAHSHSTVSSRRRDMLRHVVPCGDRRAAMAWLRRPDVRSALGVPGPKDLDWQPCSDEIRYTFQYSSLIFTHKTLMNKGLRVLIYSGDSDYVVPFTGTRGWIYDLGLKESREYTPWLINGQVVGFTSTFRADQFPQQSFKHLDADLRSRSRSTETFEEEAARWSGVLIFATVKGAGHMVPQTKPAVAAAMLARFLAGSPL